LELLWFLSGSTDVTDLQHYGVKIWDAHSSPEFLKKRGLGYLKNDIGLGYGYQWRHWGGVDQIAELIQNLKNDPFSRRHVLSAWNVSDLNKMALPPCHLLYMFKVSNQENKTLNCKVVIRSNDMFLGHPFNVYEASLLTILLARECNMTPGNVAVAITDAHIYKATTVQIPNNNNTRIFI
jgi:thymidylate synthase